MTEIPKGHGKWHGGKGSTPKQSDHQKYTENYDKIFGRKDKGLSDREKVLMDPLAASQRSDMTDEFPDRARPDGLVWQKYLKDQKAPPMPHGLQRAWDRKNKDKNDNT